MLSGEFQVNKDFDINNLYLNLTFHKATETFEYKNPLLDHPSNYQLVVTKFLSKVNFPYIRLHETKKNPTLIMCGSKLFIYDYFIRIIYRRQGSEGFGDINYNTFLQTPYGIEEHEGTIEPMLKTKIKNYEDLDSTDYIDEYSEYKKVDDDNDDDDGDNDDIDDDDDIKRKPKQLYWFHENEKTRIYNIQDFVSILNVSLSDAFERMMNELANAVGEDAVFEEFKKKYDGMILMFFRYEGGRLKLYIDGGLEDFFVV